MGLGKRIGEKCNRQGLTIRQLSLKAGVPYSTLYSAIKRDSDGMDFETVKKLAAALDAPWYEFYPGDETNRDVVDWSPSKDDSYKEQLDSAGAYLTELLTTAEWESGTDWTVDEENNWKKKKVPEVAKKFNLNESDLLDNILWFYPENEEWLGEIQEAIAKFNHRNNGQIIFKYIERICRALTGMSTEGQEEAAKRVQELAQISAYQRKQDTRNLPGGIDDETPTAK